MIMKYTKELRFKSYKNMLHVMSYEFLITDNLKIAKKNLKEYWDSLPSKIRNHPHFDKAFRKLIERRT